MNLFHDVREIILGVLAGWKASGRLPETLSFDRVTCEPPREERFGDMATNAAMVLAKDARQSPLALAEDLAKELREHPKIQSAEVAAPGFINLTLPPEVWQAHLATIIALQHAYGESQLGAGKSVNIEFVSANPTGPLHAGHARIAVVGDVLARLLDKVGFRVKREYYINDAGNQVEVLARSVYLRYREALGLAFDGIPEGHYPGEYLISVGQALAARDGTKWVDRPEAEWLETLGAFAVEHMMESIRKDLQLLDIHFDAFTSERKLVKEGAVEQAVHSLERLGLVYTGVLEPPKGMVPEDWEPRPQLLFRSTSYGDDVDRPLKKSDGGWTYFATDIAYHADKAQRGAELLINVWGADHGGYIKRTQAAIKAMGKKETELHIVICQLVNLFNKGEALRMSKRAGTFITLQEVVESVGKDVVRFIMMTRKSDVTLDFDYAKVQEQSKDNPVFYVQYAHARARSVQRQAEKLMPQLLQAGNQEICLSLLTEDIELKVIKKLAEWPRLVELAARLYEPHRLAFYLYDLAAAFHVLWHQGKDDAAMRLILPENIPLTQARLAIVDAVRNVIASGLEIFGVTAVEEMH